MSNQTTDLPTKPKKNCRFLELIKKHKPPAQEFHLACEIMLFFIAVISFLSWKFPHVLWFHSACDLVSIFVGGSLSIVSMLHAIKEWRASPYV